MIYLLLAIFSGTATSVIMRCSKSRIKSDMGMLAANYLACTLLAGYFAGAGELFPAGAGGALGLGLFNGALYLISLMLMQYNVPRSGIVLTSIYSKLSLIVPLVLSLTVFGEKPGAAQIIGFLLSLAAIVMINYQPGAEAPQVNGGLLALFAVDGCVYSMSKIFEELFGQNFSAQFLFYTFGVALLISAGMLLAKKERPGWPDLLFGFLFGIPNYFASRLTLKALSVLPAVIVYPTNGVGTLAAVAVAGVLIFKERLTKRQWEAVAIILLAIALLNL